MKIEGNQKELDAMVEFHKGNRVEGLRLQEEFAAEFRKEYKDKDHCPCLKACRYHGNCKECVAIHRAHQEHVPNCMRPKNNKKLKLDLVSYIELANRQIFFDAFNKSIREYCNHFKIGGYKIFLDGSPQGRTAWMRTPYKGDNKYFGYNTMDDNDVEETIKIAKDTNMQLLAHCNGDKAAEQYINSIKKFEDGIENIRPVMIHAQLLGIDQLSDLKKHNIIPSFFIAHIFYWGDIHIENFGYERASQISPANSALGQDILFTFHQDSPVINPNMFETIWCATTRKTKKGIILGENETISVLDAIKAVTINSAYQYFEENKKGSIKEGKLADLIIVDKNPLEIDLDEIKNIYLLTYILPFINSYLIQRILYIFC